MYAETGRPSIPPEHLLKACLLIALYSVRSERTVSVSDCIMTCYSNGFSDLNIIDPAFDASTFSKNKERLLENEVARKFLGSGTGKEARLNASKLLSEDHFTVDGTLLEAMGVLEELLSERWKRCTRS